MLNSLLVELAQEYLSEYSEEEISQIESRNMPENWKVQDWLRLMTGEVDIFYINTYEYQGLEETDIPPELLTAIKESAENRKHELDDIKVVFPRRYRPSKPLPQNWEEKYSWMSIIDYWQKSYIKKENRTTNPPVNKGMDHW
jgi:hypothetical protein